MPIPIQSTPTETIIPAVGPKITTGAAIVSGVGWFNSDILFAVGGFVVALVVGVTTIYFKHKDNQRAIAKLAADEKRAAREERRRELELADKREIAKLRSELLQAAIRGNSVGCLDDFNDTIKAVDFAASDMMSADDLFRELPPADGKKKPKPNGGAPDVRQ